MVKREGIVNKGVSKEPFFLLDHKWNGSESATPVNAISHSRFGTPYTQNFLAKSNGY